MGAEVAAGAKGLATERAVEGSLPGVHDANVRSAVVPERKRHFAFVALERPLLLVRARSVARQVRLADKGLCADLAHKRPNSGMHASVGVQHPLEGELLEADVAGVRSSMCTHVGLKPTRLGKALEADVAFMAAAAVAVVVVAAASAVGYCPRHAIVCRSAI